MATLNGQIGFRAWALKRDEHGHWNLHPVSYGQHVWSATEVNTAICAAHGSPSHKAPKRECSCGFYNYYEPKDQWSGVRGATLCWGKMVGHGKSGFRAQHARVIGLVKPTAEQIEKPNPPARPSELTEKAHVLMYAEHSVDDLMKMAQRIYELNPLNRKDAGWKPPTIEQVSAAKKRFETVAVSLKAVKDKYENELAAYQERVNAWYGDALKEITEQWPGVPLFPDMKSLIAYCGEIGRVGPPK